MPTSSASGVECNPTGYTKLIVRYYNSNTGRFTEPDTIVRLADPRNGNLYAYAGDQPCNNTDLSGARFVGCVNSLAAMYLSILGAPDAPPLAFAGLVSSVVGLADSCPPVPPNASTPPEAE